MTPAIKERYSNVAIGLHWLMAFMLIGMLAFGKIMVNMDDTSPLRFMFTQWHKTAGISLLFLALLRLLWRLSHKAPAHPAKAPAWEKLAAGGTHVLLYFLLFLIPISGWLLVSASPLNIDTRLFGVINFPHFPAIEALGDKAELSERFHNAHEWLSHGLILLIVLHVGAAFKHYLFDKDEVMQHMLPPRKNAGFRKLMWLFAGLAALLTVGVQALSLTQKSAPALSSGASQVSFIASVMGERTDATFTETQVTASIDLNNIEASTLHAVVTTATVQSSNDQVEGSLPQAEWFNVEQFAQAHFRATQFQDAGNGELSLSGDLTIKSTTKSFTFPIQITESEGVSSIQGQFAVNRLDFNLGAESQPTDDYVALEVVISFQFELNSPK